MSPLDAEQERNVNRGAENVRTEYQVASEHHMHQMGTRFTIAGFYIAAMGFLLQSLVSDTSDFGTRLITCALGIVLTVPIWILELRTRHLIRLYARRMVQIEHDNWNLRQNSGFTGVMSQIYKSPVPEQYDRATEYPVEPQSYRIKLPRMPKRLLPLSFIGEEISHSHGFDLLYGLCIIFWLAVSIYFICSQLISIPSSSITQGVPTTPINFPLPTSIATYTPSVSTVP